MKSRLMALAIMINLLIFSNQLLADVNVLIIGSTHSYSEGGESGVVHEKPFNLTTIATRLQSILAGDSAITGPINVQFEDIYKTKTLITPIGAGGTPWTLDYHCYSLMQHFMWPENKTTRMANIRGEGTYVWDYIILCEDPYVMANFPGVYAEAVKLFKGEIANSANPAQLVLLAQWPETTSTYTADDFNKIAYRIGNSGGIAVVPAGKAWNGYTSKDTSTTHPTPKGQYLAAAAIYSKLYNRNAKTSSYVYPSDGSAIADLALSTVQTNNGSSQYTGKYTTANAFQMEYFQGRQVDWNEYGTSTEEGFANGLFAAFSSAKVNNVRRNPPTTGNPVHLSYSRANDNFEPDKQYQVNAAMFNRVHGFPMGDHQGVAGTEAGQLTMRYGIDKRYFTGSSFENGTDLGIAYSMIRENQISSNVRGIPVRLLWSKINHFQPTILSHRDGWHLSNELDRAVGAYLYTVLSGRCPVEPEPADAQTTTVWKQWWCRKLGYETAWQMAHLTTRAPGFKVSPSSASALSITPSTTETMTVNFVNPPQSNVIVNISVSNTNAASLSTQTLTFTPANYNVPQQVVVTGLAGSLGSESFNVTYSTSSTDEIYNQISDSWGYTINRPITVTFDANGGTAASPTSKSVTPSTTYGTLATTSRAGFTFNGWYTAASGGTLVTSATTVTTITNHILYARWAANSTATFNENGGTTPSLAGIAVTEGLPYGTLATTSRVGYTFNGWFTASSGGSLVTSSTTVTALSNHTLYAQWTVAATYTVTYLGNGNTSGTVPSNQTKTHTVDLTLATNTGNLTKSGFVFAGWNTALDGSGSAYAVGATYTGNAALTLYARWNIPPVVNAGSDQSVTLGASVPWSPTALSPQLWLDGSTATNNAGTVSIVNAGSGGGTISGPAALAAGGIGTLQAVQFNAASKYLTGDYTNTGTTLSAFFVGKSSNATQTAYAGMMSVWTNGQASDWNNAGSSVLFNQNNATQNSVQTYRNAALSSTTGTLTAGFLAGTVFDGTTNTAYLNGTAATGVASSGAFNAGKVVLGARWQSSIFSNWWNGNFGEAIICNANLSTTDRQNVEGYLAHKWGMAGNLAVGHPHKNLPPGVTGAVATLDGTATDTDALTYAWSVVSGPASVTFANSTAIDTTANFTAAGVYSLRLTTSDGLAQVSDDVVITVNAPGSNHSVTYNGNGSTGGTVPVDASSPYTNGSPVTVLGNTGTLVRTGYTFNNWNTAANGSGISYSPAATFSISTPTTLYAQWTINNYTITFNSAGGSAVTAITQNFGTTVTAPANPTRSGYTFAGWSPALPSTMPAGNQTVTAQWTITTYTITFDSVGGTAVTAITQNFGTTVTAPANPTRSGYTFAGWSPALPSTMPASSQTVTAQWTINNYTITFNSAGGSAVTAITQNFGATVTAPTNPTRSGYTFAGWSPVLPSTMPAGNQTVTAQWTITTYTITFDSVGGTAVTAITQNFGTTVTAPTNPTRSGYTFTGWSPALPSTMPASSQTVTAQWTINNYTITFNSAGGSAVTAITQNFGTTVTAPANPTRSGYTFTGWSPALPSTMPASSQTVTAQWNALPVANAGTDQTVILSATPWSPAQLTTQLWLDADDTNTISLNGATVSEWRDKSGNSRHAAQITTTSQPTRTTAALNGKSVLTFDGTADFLNLGIGLDFLAGVSHSAFIVTKATVFQNIYGAANGSAGANSLHVGFASNTTYRMNYWGNDYGSAFTSNFVSGSTNIMNYVWIPGTSKQILANGKSEGSNSSAGVIGTMAGGGRIGNVVGQGFFGGDIAELIFCTGTVSTTDREKLEGHLAHKWGLTGNLASNHPYKNTAPGGSGVVATLDGTATDSDSGSLTTTWSVVSGPAAVSFANSSAIDTTATFTALGTYTLRLTVSDGVSQSTEDVIITVIEPPYTSWSGSTFTNSFTNTASTSNPDGDNLTNLQEFAFGMDPTSPATGSLAYAVGGNVTKVGTPLMQNFAATGQPADYRAVFARRKDYSLAGITYTVQFSADLILWTASATAPAVQTGAGSSGNIEAVSIPFPASVSLQAGGSAAPKFFRVGVSSP